MAWLVERSPTMHKASPALHEQDIGSKDSNPSSQEREEQGLEVQGHPLLCDEFKVTLGYMRPCL